MITGQDRTEFSLLNYPLTWLAMFLMLPSPYLGIFIGIRAGFSPSGILKSAFITFASFAVLPFCAWYLERFVLSQVHQLFVRKLVLWLMVCVLAVGMYFIFTSELPLSSKGGAFFLVSGALTPITILMRKRQH